MRSQLYCEKYENIDDSNKRLAIIITDNTDANPEQIDQTRKDIDAIKQLLADLGFVTIKEIKNKAKNVIVKQISDFCTFDETNNGYIIVFNLTYKCGSDVYLTGRTSFTSEDIHDIFVENNLMEWANKPKLIFHQNQKIRRDNDNRASNNCQSDNAVRMAPEQVEILTGADIFESFSNSGEQDSYGDDNGSFYIQELCKIIRNTRGDEDIMKMTYTLHKEVTDRVQQLNTGARQTPYIKSTFQKIFAFP